MGAEFETIDGELAAKPGIKGGVQVKILGAGKLKNFTEMREGFIITKVDGKIVKSVDNLTRFVENKKCGVLLEGAYEDLPGVYYNYAFGL